MRGSPREISGTTRLVGLLGGDVRHSLSLRLHNEAFEALGLDWVYVPLPVPGGNPRRLREAVHGLRALGMVGANVTMPHKQAVVAYLDDLTDAARRIGAVNAIRVAEDGRLIGENTDADGFVADLDAHGVDWRQRPALVLGAGGAARAVTDAIAARGCRRLTIVNRTYARAVELAGMLCRHHPSVRPQVEPWPAKGAPSDALIINCTSVGMTGTPTAEQSPWPDTVSFQPGQVVVDLVYTPLVTPLMQQARRDGVEQVLSGLGMLVQQAALAFGWWTHETPPVETMLATVSGQLSGLRRRPSAVAG